MGFSDRIQQADGITVALNCGLCGQLAYENHRCAKRMLRDAATVKVTCLAEPDSSDPLDDFLVQTEDGSEEYVTVRRNIEANYKEI